MALSARALPTPGRAVRKSLTRILRAAGCARAALGSTARALMARLRDARAERASAALALAALRSSAVSSGSI